MPSLNSVMLMGNLTRDCQIKYTPKGTCIAEFALAVNRVWTDEGGTKHEEVTFCEIVFFARRAEALAGLKKGSPLFVNGRLKQEQWEDKQSGQKRSKLIIVGEDFQFLAPKAKGETEEEPEE